MASVPLRFIPPDSDSLTSLKIWESVAAAGPYNLIETVNAIGVAPDYISEHTTDDALLADDWFAISWVDSTGYETPLSAGLKGGTTTLVGEIVRRVKERDSSLNLQVIRQEAEAAAQTVFGDDFDPYTTELPNYRILNGLTYLVLARTLMVRVLQSNANSVTIGMVSMRSSSASSEEKNIERLLDLANVQLGMSISVVMLMEEISIGNSISSWRHDQSRLVLEVGLG